MAMNGHHASWRSGNQAQDGAQIPCLPAGQDRWLRCLPPVAQVRAGVQVGTPTAQCCAGLHEGAGMKGGRCPDSVGARRGVQAVVCRQWKAGRWGVWGVLARPPWGWGWGRSHRVHTPPSAAVTQIRRRLRLQPGRQSGPWGLPSRSRRDPSLAAVCPPPQRVLPWTQMDRQPRGRS